MQLSYWCCWLVVVFVDDDLSLLLLLVVVMFQWIVVVGYDSMDSRSFQHRSCMLLSCRVVVGWLVAFVVDV